MTVARIRTSEVWFLPSGSTLCKRHEIHIHTLGVAGLKSGPLDAPSIRPIASRIGGHDLGFDRAPRFVTSSDSSPSIIAVGTARNGMLIAETKKRLKVL